MSRTIAIGDIHGCAQALRTLIEMIAPASDDTLVALGDYIDRGPDSRGVVCQLLQLREQCRLIPLLGNHEIMMLSALRGEFAPLLWQRYGGMETIASYGGSLSKIDSEHIEFLSGCQHFHESETHIFMHANYVADLALNEQPENVLFWTHISSVLPPPHESGKKAVVGHTPQVEGDILDLGHLVCIDTCCFAGGWLTALDTTTGQTWQVDRLGRLREPQRE
jgi:serine/threonine protein phosphatase 1